jgi:hypothetical protein
MNKPIKTIMPSFADDVVSALGSPKRAISPYEANPIGKRHMNLTRANIRQSERFTVGDDVLEQACKLSLDITVPELAELLEYCRPPFNLTWIDWDETKRQEILVDAINKDQSKSVAYIKESEQANRVGYLISPATTQYNKESTINIPDGFYIEGFLELKHDKTFIWCPPIGTLIKPTGFNNSDWEQILVQDQSWKTRELATHYQTLLKDCTSDSLIPPVNRDLFKGQMAALMNQMGRGWFMDEVKKAENELKSYELDKYPRLMKAKEVCEYLWGQYGRTERARLNAIQNKGQLKSARLGEKGAHWFPREDVYDLAKQSINEDEIVKHLGVTGIMDKSVTSQVGSMAWTVPEWKYNEGWTSEDMAEFHNKQALAMDGDLRLLIILFSLLYKKNVSYGAPVKSNRKLRPTGKVTPANEYYVLTLDTSDTHVTTYMDSARGRPPRRHGVRGYWQRRSGKLVWVNSYKRGNSELGTIIKDYEMTGV